MSRSKKTENMTVKKRKGIDLLFEVALIEEAQYEEVLKKSLRDFHKTHPSGSGIVTKTDPKIKPSITNEGTSVKPGVPDVTEEVSTESEHESWGKDENDNNNEQDSGSEGSDQERDSGDDNTQYDSEKRSDSEHETDKNESGSESDQEENEKEIRDDEEEEEDVFVKTSSNDSDDEDETKITDKAEDIPTTKAEIVSPMDVHVHHEVPSKQTPTLLTISVLVITKSSPIYSTIIPLSIPSFTPPPPQSTPTPPPTTEATNPQSALLDLASIFQFNNRVTTLEKDVSELKKDDPLKT
ncbi:hypothetical protein Tco_1314574 [Tanacetum coccineum]